MYNTTENNKTDIAMYAVFRNGVRVSDSEYDSKSGAQNEYMYWAGIISRFPDGSKLEIRQLNQYYKR